MVFFFIGFKNSGASHLKKAAFIAPDGNPAYYEGRGIYEREEASSRLNERIVEMALFKKKEALDPDKVWFGVGIMTDHGLSDEAYDALSNKILDAVGNVAVVSDLVRVEWDKEKLKHLNERFDNPRYTDPCFTINEVIQGDIDKEKKLLQQSNKWKRVFGLISPIDYMVAETKAVHDFEKSLLYTNNVDEVIEFLKNAHR